MELHATHIQAGNSLSTAEELRELLKLKDQEIRLRLAENPASPPDVLAKLSDDPDPDVRAFVAGNPSTPKHIVQRLSEDEHGDIRYSMASNPCLPLEILYKLGQDQNPFVSDRAQKTIAGIALELALEQQGFLSFPGTQARLGELLVASGAIDEEEIEAFVVLAANMKIPMGRAIVQAGRLDRNVIVCALKQQTMVRLGQVTLEIAVDEIKKCAQQRQCLA